MSRRMRAVAVALVLAFALAGCVGIPTSGGVNVGTVIKGGGGTSFAPLPAGPQKDSTKNEILTDFMQAVTSPDRDYEIAKLFLTKSAAQNWHPNKSVLIREGAASQTDAGGNAIQYAVTTKASVGATGVYAEYPQGTQDLTFGFTKVGGQWRINSLADGTVVSRSTFQQVFSSHPLYFFDPAFAFLVPDVRWFPTGSTVQTRIVSALLGGPADWLQQGAVSTAFPSGTSLATAVELKSSLAIVDLSDEASNTKMIDRARMLQQLTQSLGQQVTMTVGGSPLPVADPTESQAQVPVAADSTPLVLRGTRFGFEPTLKSIGRISAQVVAVDARAVALGHDQASAAALGKDGVYYLSESLATPRLIDSRPGLIAPSIDVDHFVWSVPAGDGSAIRATGPDGVAHNVASSIPKKATIVTIAVSRDGTRLLLYLQTQAGPRLIVAGIIRSNSVPMSLGALLDLPVSGANPIDATWLDSSTIAALSGAVGNADVTSYGIGGPSVDLGTAPGAVHIVGGNGQDELRVITSFGIVQQYRSSGWQSLGTTATLLGTQQ